MPNSQKLIDLELLTQYDTKIKEVINTKADSTDIKNGQLTIKQNGVTKATFSANNENNVEANLDLEIATSEKIGGVKPVTKTSEMTSEVGIDSSGRLWSKNSSSGGYGNASIQRFDPDTSNSTAYDIFTAEQTGENIYELDISVSPYTSCYTGIAQNGITFQIQVPNISNLSSYRLYKDIVVRPDEKFYIDVQINGNYILGTVKYNGSDYYSDVYTINSKRWFISIKINSKTGEQSIYTRIRETGSVLF